MGRLTFDLQPIGPWGGKTVDEHNAYMREEYGPFAAWKDNLAPCNCGYHTPDMLCVCWPDWRTPEKGRERLEFAARQEHKKALRAKREFPGAPCDGKGTGWCRWCGAEIINPKTGKRHRQRTWCADGRCLKQYYLHTSHVSQRHYLRERDGRGCKACGSETYGDVDHLIALGAAWEAFGAAPDRFRWFFSPANLQLLCGDCHRAKTRDDVAFIRKCQANGPQWAKGEILRRLGNAGLLR